jgi:hypothetical protein
VVGKRERVTARGDRDSSHAIGNFEFEAALPYKRGERLRRDYVIKGSM